MPPNSILQTVKLLAIGFAFFALAGVGSCVFLPVPTALYQNGDESSDFIARLIHPSDGSEAVVMSDSRTQFSGAVAGVGDIYAYRVKIGASVLTDCASEVGYSSWSPVTDVLNLDLSSTPNGLIRLCLVGRGMNNGAPVEQKLPAATIYEWEKIEQPAGPGEFAIISPAGDVQGLTQTVSWSDSAGADNYLLKVATDPNCATGSVTELQVDAPAASYPVTLPEPGAYHVCMSARGTDGQATVATNDGIAFSTQPIVAVLRDHVTNPLNWNGLGVAENSVDAVDKTTVVGVFEGDGGVVSKIGLVMATADGFGEPTSADPTPFDWYVNFYDSLDALAANPFSQNDALPETKFFDQPTNVGWQTVIGTSHAGYLLRYIEFDVSAEGWTTTPGELQGIGVFSKVGGFVVPMQTGVALSSGVSAIGQHDDWTAARFGDDLFGPDTLIDFGYAERFAAFKIETRR